jgi:hypothetical protein
MQLISCQGVPPSLRCFNRMISENCRQSVLHFIVEASNYTVGDQLLFIVVLIMVLVHVGMY